MSLAHDLDSQGRTKEHRGETRVQPVKEDKTASDFPIETCSGSLSSCADDLFAAWSPSCDGQSDALAPTTRRHCLARFQPPASCSPSSSKSCSPSTNTRSGNWHAFGGINRQSGFRLFCNHVSVMSFGLLGASCKPYRRTAPLLTSAQWLVATSTVSSSSTPTSEDTTQGQHTSCMSQVLTLQRLFLGLLGFAAFLSRPSFPSWLRTMVHDTTSNAPQALVPGRGLTHLT